MFMAQLIGHCIVNAEARGLFDESPSNFFSGPESCFVFTAFTFKKKVQ